MKFIDLLNLTYNEIDEIDEDEQIEIIVKGGINEAYSILCQKDIRLNRAYIPIINGVATLPEDFISVIKCTPELTNERIIGNSIITDKEGTYELLYSYVREQLENDNDEPDLHLTLQYALIQYACYKYFLHRKKINVADSFYKNYEMYIYKFETEKNGSYRAETITFVDMSS